MVKRAEAAGPSRQQFAAFYDVDGDGTNEIISMQEAAGTADHANLVFCKSSRGDQLLWSAPLRRKLSFSAHSGTESDLFRPKSIVGEALKYKSKFNRAYWMDIQKDSKKFFVLLDDICPADQMYFIVNSAKLPGLFNFNLEVESFDSASDYDLMAEKLFDDGHIPRSPDKAYFEEYQNNLRYWDGEGWQNQPLMNRHYQEACKFK
ncbi:MAG: hypothetical protein ACREOO_28660 [bacterium]